MTDYSILSRRRYYIGTISFLLPNSYELYEDKTWTLPYQTLRYLSHFGSRMSMELLAFRNTHFVVHNLYEQYAEMVMRVIETQKIKQELFKRTIPNYQPPTIRQQLTEQLGFDVSHISVRAIRLIQYWFTMYYHIDQRATFGEDDYFDSSQNEVIYTFDLITSAMSSTCTFKEELAAQVYHPDNVDKWVNYV